MARKFSSLEGVISYIKNTCHEEALREISEKSIETMQEVTKEQVTGDTGDIINCIGVTNIDNNSVLIEWQDKGDWFSVAKDTYGQHMYAPWALENGKTFAPGKPMFSGFYKEPTTLALTSKEIIEKDAPDTYRSVMKSKGFKVR